MQSTPKQTLLSGTKSDSVPPPSLSLTDHVDDGESTDTEDEEIITSLPRSSPPSSTLLQGSSSAPVTTVSADDKWTSEELAALQEGIDVYGPKCFWIEIKAMGGDRLARRQPAQLMDKYISMERSKRLQKEKETMEEEMVNRSSTPVPFSVTKKVKDEMKESRSGGDGDMPVDWKLPPDWKAVNQSSR